jgi:hypothetical protein
MINKIIIKEECINKIRKKITDKLYVQKKE